MKIENRIAQGLLNIGAVKINVENPFTWTSGLKSPIYCDNRKTLSDVDLRTFIRDSFVEYINANHPDTEAIGGIATAGIAQGALIAQQLELPYFYVRPEPKKHGMKNQIEGYLKKGAKVILIEDLISTGMSSLKAVDACREEGSEVLKVLSIFTYGFDKSVKAFKDSNCGFACLSSLTALLSLAKENKSINEEDYNSLLDWQNNIQEWSDARS